MKQVYLDLRTTTLYGWEEIKPIRAVDYMLRAAVAGAKFRQVRVREAENGWNLIKFREDPHDFVLDGGHKRAIAHYLLGQPLHCSDLTIDSEKSFGTGMTVRLEDILLVGDEAAGVSPAWYERFESSFPHLRYDEGSTMLALPHGRQSITVAEAARLVRPTARYRGF